MNHLVTPTGVAVLFALLAALILTDLGGTGVFDYDEANAAEMARQMYVSGDWLNPVVNGEGFYEKPPLLYWAQASGYHVFGVGSLGARALNALAGLALLGAVYSFARGPLGPLGAVLALLVLGTSLGFVALARVAMTDMLLTLWMFLSVAALHRAFEDWDEGGGFGWLMAACVGSGLAMLTKGAIGALLPGGAAFLFLVWHRRLAAVVRRVHWMAAALALLIGLGSSWYLLLGFTHPEGFAFMRTLFVEHHVGRFLSPMQGHSGPIFYYLPVLFVGFLPWSPFALLALTRGELGDAGEARVRFLRLFGVFGALTFVLFSVSATKLPHYAAPMLPTLALLAGDVLQRARAPEVGRSRGWAGAVWFAAGGAIFIGLLVVATPWVLAALPGWLGDAVFKQPGLAEPVELGLWPLIGGAALASGGLCALLPGQRRRPSGVVTALASGTLVFLFVLVLALLPRFDSHFRAPLRDLGQQAAVEAFPGRRIVLLGIRRVPSIPFYGGRETRYISSEGRDQIEELFAGPQAEVGITIEPYLERVRAYGTPEVIARSGGYALFRCRPGGRAPAPPGDLPRMGSR